MKLVRDNNGENYIYLVNKIDLNDIFKTGIIKERENNNIKDKVYVIKENNESTEIKILVLKNIKTNKISDDVEKIDFLIINGIEQSDYELRKIAIDRYLEIKYEIIEKKKNNKEEIEDTINDNDSENIGEKIKEELISKIIEEIYNFSVNNINRKLEKNSKIDIDKKIRTIESVEGDNETLIISEKQNKIYLPYTIDELEEYLKSYPTMYISLEKVVEKEFVIPLNSFYKHPLYSRFFESYNLIKNREGKNSIIAFAYAMKTATKNNLNPAVIAACKSEKELNFYINCLNSNSLDKFKSFEIIFEAETA